MATSTEIQEKYTAQFAELEKQINAEAAKLTKDGKQLEKDAQTEFKVDMKVEWKRQDFSLDLPSITMSTKEISLDLPQVTMRNKDIVFHTPSVRMVPKVVGKYPVWHGPFHMEWKDLIVEVPETFMEEQRIVLGLPEVRIERTSMKLDIPEVTMKRTDFSLDLPSVTVKDISFVIPIETDDMKRRGNDLKLRGDELATSGKKRAEEMANAMKNELLASAFSDYSGQVATSNKAIQTAQTTVARQADAAVDSIDTVLKANADKLAPADIQKLAADQQAILDAKQRALEELKRLAISGPPANP